MRSDRKRSWSSSRSSYSISRGPSSIDYSSGNYGPDPPRGRRRSPRNRSGSIGTSGRRNSRDVSNNYWSSDEDASNGNYSTESDRWSRRRGPPRSVSPATLRGGRESPLWGWPETRTVTDSNSSSGSVPLPPPGLVARRLVEPGESLVRDYERRGFKVSHIQGGGDDDDDDDDDNIGNNGNNGNNGGDGPSRARKKNRTRREGDVPTEGFPIEGAIASGRHRSSTVAGPTALERALRRHAGKGAVASLYFAYWEVAGPSRSPRPMRSVTRMSAHVLADHLAQTAFSSTSGAVPLGGSGPVMRPLPHLMRDWCAHGETRIKAWPAVLRARGALSVCKFSPRGTAVLSDGAVRFVRDADANATRSGKTGEKGLKWERRHDAHAQWIASSRNSKNNSSNNSYKKHNDPSCGGRAIALEEIDSIVFGVIGCTEGTDWPPWEGGRVRGAGGATIVITGGKGAVRMKLEVRDQTGSEEGGRLASLEIAAEIAWAVAHAAAALGNPIPGGPRADPTLRAGGGCFC